LARTAVKVASSALSRYSNKFSRRDFTQPQLFAVAVLRQFFKTDYRGIVALLADMPEMVAFLKLSKLPHWTTVQKFEQRLQKKGPTPDCWPPSGAAPAVAV
jgi:hypothetical protein